MKSFRDMKFRILIATDVAARGIDVPHIEHVINYDLPQMAEDFIHRIGRTARAGSKGIALSFVTKGDFAKWKEIQKIFNPEKNYKNQKNSKIKKTKKQFNKKREGNKRTSFKKKSNYKKSFSKNTEVQDENKYSKKKFTKNKRTEQSTSKKKISFSRKIKTNHGIGGKKSSNKKLRNSNKNKIHNFNSPRKRRK